MAKVKVDVEKLMSKVQALGAEASGGIDALMDEAKELRVAAKAEAQVILDKAEGRVKMILEQVEPLNELYKTATGRYYVSTAATAKAANKAAGGGGKRRSREELETLAAQVVGYIKQAGKDGATGAEIKGKFGPLLPSTNQFLRQYAPDTKIKTAGAKAQMRYLV